jgi:hypothetical protein
VASRLHARALDPDDLAAIAPLDAAYAASYGLEPAVTAGSLSFYARTGHAFTGMHGGEARGFVLAQAVWDGARPTVWAARLAVAEPGEGLRRALLEALTKSAYDAAVYDLVVLAPEGDAELRAALGEMQYRPAPLRFFARTLGSRGQKG